ncbi:DNA mismatch repair endonuclease MutL [Flavobacteriales bacterium]|nr:DNA mismatch repair endonuclease MutL [Flavobacteriales bacterium]
MPDVIKLLPDHVASQIAAGEVVQRPASVVKELLENAVDAKAENIQVILKDAGRSLIQVIDDGIGMNPTDSKMCFEKHATSKIESVDDLFSIQTKGFRGEAMSSIAAVAQVDIKSRTANEELGTRLIIEGSEVKLNEPCPTITGTNIQVKNLFYNVPARRNFLKSNTAELRRIIEEFLRIALTHPELGMKLNHNGNEVHNLIGQSLRQRIVAIMGKNYNEKLVPIEEDTTIIKVSGFIGKPEAARKTRGEQYFFVNNRFIKSPYLNHAVVKAYEELIAPDQHPSYFIYLTVDPATIDVNIHPTKTEIKFEDERAIYAILRSASKQSLGRYNIAPTLDFDQETSFEINPLPKDRTVSPPHVKGDPDYNPFHLSSAQSDFTGKKASSSDILALENMYKNANDSPNVVNDEEELMEVQEQRLPYQLHKRYIINHIKSGFILIDQQKAHERILFERYIQKIANNAISAQQVLFPITIELNNQDIVLLQSVSKQLNGMGFDVSEFGQGSIIINAIPSVVNEMNLQHAFELILSSLKDEDQIHIRFEEKLARSMAKAECIKSGQTLSVLEMQNLIDELFACEQPFYSPAGKPTTVNVPLEEFEKKFDL